MSTLRTTDMPGIPEKNGRISVAGLTQRGWTKRMVERLLGEPDWLADNPHYRSAPPMRLYDLNRVQTIEATPEFAELRAKAEARSARGRKVAERKAEQTRDSAKAFVFVLPEFDPSDLVQEAIEHRNAVREYHFRGNRREDFSPAFAPAVPLWPEEDADRDRWCVNYLRHVCTDYDRVLNDFSGRIGRRAAALVVFENFVEAVAAQYPFLAEEARRQLAARREKAKEIENLPRWPLF